MESDKSLADLMQSIYQAIEKGTLHEDYSFWEDYCRREYNISTYTLQLLVKHCLACPKNSDNKTSIPIEISPSLIDFSKDKIIYKDKIVERTDKQIPQYTMFGIVILCFLILACVAGLYNMNTQIAQKQKIIDEVHLQKDKEQIAFTKKIESIETYINAIDSLIFLVGTSRIKTTDTYDNGWRMWLEAKVPVCINSFYIKPNTSGRITIALYSEDNKFVGDCSLNVKGGRFNYVHSNFLIKKTGRYYMYISASNGVSLQYHSSSNMEYNHFLQGALQIIGCSGNSSKERSAQTKRDYYQYFYDIGYSILKND